MSNNPYSQNGEANRGGKEININIKWGVKPRILFLFFGI